MAARRLALNRMGEMMPVQSYSARSLIYLTEFAMTVFLLAVTPSASAQQNFSAGSSRLEAMLRDAETAAGLAASGKQLYEAETNKQTWKQYCSMSGAFARRGEFRQAVRAASKALFLGQDTNDAIAMAFASMDLAVAYNFAGELDRAEEWANRSLVQVNRSQLRSDRGAVISANQKILGDVAMRRGVTEMALKHYQRALYELYGNSPNRLPIKLSIVNAEIRRGNFIAARQQLDDIGAGEGEWVPFVARARGQLAHAEGSHLKAAEHFTTAVNEMRGDKDSYHLLWMQHGLAQALAAAGDRDKALASYREAMNSAQQLRTQFRSSEFRAGFFGDVQTIYDEAISLLVDLKRFDDALALSEESRARTLIDALKGQAKNEPLDTAQAVAKLPPNTLAAVYHVLNNRTIVWLVRSGVTEAAIIPVGRKELTTLVDGFRRAIVSRSTDTLPQSRKLFELIISPLNLRADELLVFVPHKSLHYLPVQALAGAKEYLIEERPISTVPSLNAMAALAESQADTKPTMLAMGNPELGNPAFALPGAEQEVKNIGNLYPDAKIYMHLEAHKPRFLTQASGNGIIHIAAHATVDEIDPLYSSIRLAKADLPKGDLEAHEIMGMDLSAARLVVLSACDSGLGKVSGGDEFFGFKRSFLAAGARSLLLSLWQIDDDASALLMSSFYRELRGKSIIDSLRQAQLDLLKAPATADPVFWAPFILVGAWK